jgi:hypothetical protein
MVTENAAFGHQKYSNRQPEIQHMVIWSAAFVREMS